MSTHQITLETLDPDQHTGEETRVELARTLEAEVGAPDEGGLFDDALAALGVDQHHRGVPRDERPPWDDDEEPPHLQGGSPHENEPAPYDPPPRDVP